MSIFIKILAILVPLIGIITFGCGMSMYILKIKNAVVGHMFLGGSTVVLAIVLTILIFIYK